MHSDFICEHVDVWLCFSSVIWSSGHKYTCSLEITEGIHSLSTSCISSTMLSFCSERKFLCVLEAAAVW